MMKKIVKRIEEKTFKLSFLINLDNETLFKKFINRKNL